jgi:branched-chain amino acid transport system permease protein
VQSFVKAFKAKYNQEPGLFAAIVYDAIKIVAALVVAALALPLLVDNPYILQILINTWLYGLLALSLTLVAGAAGQMSLGHAGLLAIGGYASALMAIDLQMTVIYRTL